MIIIKKPRLRDAEVCGSYGFSNKFNILKVFILRHVVIPLEITYSNKMGGCTISWPAIRNAKTINCLNVHFTYAECVNVAVIKSILLKEKRGKCLARLPNS